MSQLDKHKDYQRDRERFEMQSRIGRWLEDPQAAHREGERARAAVKAQFGFEPMIERTRAVYQELLNGRPAR